MEVQLFTTGNNIALFSATLIFFIVSESSLSIGQTTARDYEKRYLM